jgi:ABC-type dipeptide/oligopeptide/nickel transport system permease subunit
MLATTWGTIFAPQTYSAQRVTPWLTLFPTVMILISVICLNQISEGLRRGLEPWRTS